jgi:hypothetical protein
MTDKTNPATRRALIVGAATLAGLPFLVQPKVAHAAGTLPKANAKYQEKPSGANRCGLCNYYIPGASATAVGQCKVVAGPISPTGWCTLFAPKRA